MNKKLSMLFTAVAMSTLLYVGCKPDNDDNAAPVTCTDGIMNGTETGIDCGGTCAACVSCSDGIQNGTETDIDCGGASCLPCVAPSMTATISGIGAFVADTTPTVTYVDSSSSSSFVSHRVIGKNSVNATLRFDLNVSINPALDTIEVNKEYNVGSSGGIITTLVLYHTVSGVPATYTGNSGKIKFTKINYAARKVSGTFEFVGSTGAVTKTITGGTFTNLHLE